MSINTTNRTTGSVKKFGNNLIFINLIFMFITLATMEERSFWTNAGACRVHFPNFHSGLSAVQCRPTRQPMNLSVR